MPPSCGLTAGERSVLIVEDEAVVGLDLSLQLEALGYAVVGVATSGEEAVQSARSLSPDLILMDVRLQGAVDGIEAAARIRGVQEVPIIFLTSYSDDETVRRAARTAPYGYLTKPYQLRELRAAMEVGLTKARMERQLREADQWFAQTLRCVSDGVIVADLDAAVRFLNPAAEALTGWPLDQALGRPLDQVLRFDTPAPRAAVRREGLQGVLDQGRPTPVVYAQPLRHRDGGLRTVDETMAPLSDEAGLLLGAVVVLRDASDRVAREAALRASEQRFRQAFDHAPLGMALVSLAGGFLQANASLVRLLDADGMGLVGRDHHALVVEDDRSALDARLHALMNAAHGGQGGADVVQLECRYRRPGGREPLSALVSVSLLHEDGQPTCFLVQVHDLTAQRAAARRLAELAQERLQREAGALAAAARSEFLSRVSHEMKTPLNAVLGFSQLLQMQSLATGSEQRQGEYATHIRRAGEHLLDLVNDLLDLSRADQGRLRLACVPVALAPQVEAAWARCDDEAARRGLRWQCDVPAGLQVLGDPDRLCQVLANLLENAVRYNRDGGDVALRAREDGGRVEIEVADTGLGMSAAQTERLFRPFERVGRERGPMPGAGLGLVVARSLVEAMGGRLEVCSEAGVGTVVTLTLPGA